MIYAGSSGLGRLEDRTPGTADHESSKPTTTHRTVNLHERETDHRNQQGLGRVFAMAVFREPELACRRWVMSKPVPIYGDSPGLSSPASALLYARQCLTASRSCCLSMASLLHALLHRSRHQHQPVDRDALVRPGLSGNATSPVRHNPAIS